MNQDIPPRPGPNTCTDFIRTRSTGKPRPTWTVDTETGCHLWTGSINRTGYGWFRNKPAHKYYYEEAYPPVPVGHVLHHVCEAPSCVNPEHLVPMREEDHRALHRGKKLGWDRVLLIRAMLSVGGYRYKDLAMGFGVSPSMISEIKRGMYWVPPGHWGLGVSPSRGELLRFLESEGCPAWFRDQCFSCIPLRLYLREGALPSRVGSRRARRATIPVLPADPWKDRALLRACRS